MGSKDRRDKSDRKKRTESARHPTGDREADRYGGEDEEEGETCSEN